jgi:hypothetical protein
VIGARASRVASMAHTHRRKPESREVVDFGRSVAADFGQLIF